jgi:sensor histidine kinase YesM
MKSLEQIGQTLLKFIGSRLALNIYFWIFLFAIKFSDADDQVAYSKTFYYGMMIMLMGFFAQLSYMNNLVLMPKLLFQKKRFQYFIAILSYTFLTAFVYTFLLKWLPTVFPGLTILEMSIIMSSVSSDTSLAGIYTDIGTYMSMMSIWIIVFSLLGFYHHSVGKMKSLEQAINKHRETELAFIKNQMNPHFLFNTLNNLYALAIKKSDETPEIILQLASILRYILYESNADKMSFEKEKEIIQAYINIELLRIPQTPAVQFSIMADKPYQLPPLLWLAPLENIFKHGRSVTTPEIDFKLSIIKNQMHLYAKNNYKALQHHIQKQAGGLGLTNLRKRLDWLYPNHYLLTTEVRENYFIIELKIQLD